jgi:anhydro-N-acetylmuramic acid kinase
VAGRRPAAGRAQPGRHRQRHGARRGVRARLRHRARELCDRDGRLALAGRVDEALLARLLTEPYYAKAAPKSTGRELFTTEYVDAPDVADADLMATLTELTAVTVADACRPFGLTEVVASGGGVRNPALLAALRRRLAPTPLVTTDERGLPGDAKEAYLVALLGFLTWHQLPGVVPGGTGSTVPRVLGRLSPGDAPLHLSAPVPPPHRLVVTPP